MSSWPSNSVLLALAGISILANPVAAQHATGGKEIAADKQTESAAAAQEGVNAIPHPAVVFLDAQGQQVATSGAPVSTSKTCAACHDTKYIAQHSYHAWLGANETGFTKARPFDSGPGPLERFDPLIYERFDRNAGVDFEMGLPDWLKRYGYLHIGGGFATEKPDGTPLLELKPGDPPDPWTHTLDHGQRKPWNWAQSGVAEMNCFLCHIDRPANEARIQELAAGRFGSASTATLAGTDLVKREGSLWKWNHALLDEHGAVSDEILALRRPKSSNCGLCHGFVDAERDLPFFVEPNPRHRRTETTGQILSPHRIRRSGMNIAGKDELSRSWDVHAERLLTCVDCHGSINNPATWSESSDTRPQHLKRETRRLSYSEYLRTPSHDFAKGHSSQGELANDLDGTMRRCEDCHDAQDTHDWLPYVERHMQGLQCEACHVPRIYAPARMQTDWTMLDSSGQAQVSYRGVAAGQESQDLTSPATLIAGYVPALLPRKELDGRQRLAPQNLATTYYWVDEASGQPVALDLLRRALFGSSQRPQDGYHPAIVKALDRDGDGRLQGAELQIVDDKQVQAIAAALVRAGAKSPSIRGDIQPYGLHHDVTPGTWATRDCASCHGQDSRFSGTFVLGNYAPGGILPTLVADAPVRLAGPVRMGPDGQLIYMATPSEVGIGLLGSETSRYVDAIGSWAVLLTILGVIVHGSIRIFLAQIRRLPRIQENPGQEDNEEATA